MNIKAPLVYVRWHDSKAPHTAWVLAEHIDDSNMKADCQTVGWLVVDNDHGIKIAQSVSDEGSEGEQYLGILTIPRKCIVSINRLHEKDVLGIDAFNVDCEREEMLRQQASSPENVHPGYREECINVEQILGKALGYPLLDHTVCLQCHPVDGCTCGNPQVCVGDSTPTSLAMEAANRLAIGPLMPETPSEVDA